MSFDVLAPHYRWMEFILAGEKLQCCRTAFLDKVTSSQNVLLLGEGHGRCLVECRRHFPHAQITCVDASESMLVQSRRRLTKGKLDSDRVEFIHADVLHWSPAGELYDLIVTNFFLDCFRPDQLEQIISRLAAATTAEASWLVADFQNAAVGLKRLRSRLILWSMYVFFRAATRLPAKKITAPDSFLARTGFTLRRRIEFDWGLLHSDWWVRNKRRGAENMG